MREPSSREVPSSKLGEVDGRSRGRRDLIGGGESWSGDTPQENGWSCWAWAAAARARTGARRVMYRSLFMIFDSCAFLFGSTHRIQMKVLKSTSDRRWHCVLYNFEKYLLIGILC